ncbi:MAG: T9SS type A sorting domain-containing protein [Chitinispirillales bacterium]|jgi:hypothetical protein|nr:T9SS type A sorting domain-containing protein [Chitinispirillales bacterium]
MKIFFRGATFFSVFQAVLFLSVTAVNSETWICTGVRKISGQPSSVVWGDGQFVVVGKSGAIHTYGYSVYMERYTLEWQRPITDVDLSSIAWGKDAGYVVLGDSGKIVLTSADGVDWVKNEASTPSGAYYVSYAGGKYFAYAARSVAYYSTDGTTWEVCDGASRLVSIAYGNGVFVGVGLGGAVYTSLDGVSWEDGSDISQKYSEAICLWSDPFAPLDECAPRSVHLNTVAYGRGIFLAGGLYGALGRSKDGKLWEFFWDGDWWGDYSYIIHDGIRFIVNKDRKTYFTVNGERLELICNTYSVAKAMACNGSTKIVAIEDSDSQYLIELTKNTSSVLPNPSSPKPAAGFSLRQSGKTLRLTLPRGFRHGVRPGIALYNVSGRRQKASPVFSANGLVSLSVSHIPPGLYVLRVIGERGGWQGQVVLKR